MNILSKIIEQKRAEVAARKIAFPLEKFRGNVAASDRDFYAALEKRKREGVPAFILECKKASPSQGLIRENFDPAAIADVYANYADAISVLCDEFFFQGRYENLPIVRSLVSVPVICKEFIIDEYQIFLVRYFGADAILLMLSVLNDDEYLRFAKLAHSLKMGVLTETDSEETIARAKNLGAKVIGINNRNLRTLQTNIERTCELAKSVPAEAICVAESGLHTHADALKLATFANAFLVGTSLMRQENLDRACRQLIFGENKVCGLTDVPAARAALNAGAIFGGLIFAKKSPRCLNLSQAQKIANSIPALDYVGVFQNNSVEEILDCVKNLKLFAVQLHGNEDLNFAKKLRERLPAGTQIWRALDGNALDENCDIPAIFDRIILDCGNGGSGTSFDWKRVPVKLKNRALLAGGIGVENARSAQQIGCLGVELNSAVEDVPAKKSPEKIKQAFQNLRKF